jgi:hypothetical protein
VTPETTAPLASLPGPLPWQPMAGTAGHTRLTIEVGSHVATARRACALGERITWDVALQLMPGPQGPRPMVLVYLSTPSAVLGEVLGEMVMVEPRNLTQANTERQVAAAVDRIRQARADAARANG